VRIDVLHALSYVSVSGRGFSGVPKNNDLLIMVLRPLAVFTAVISQNKVTIKSHKQS
jgi:hypothetical protein